MSAAPPAVPVKTSFVKVILAGAGAAASNPDVQAALLGLIPGGGWVRLAMKWGLPLLGKVVSTWTADTITLEEADASIAAMVPEPLFNLVDLVTFLQRPADLP